MSETQRGELIIIGGHEDKKGDCTILKEVCNAAQKRGGALVIVTAATQLPEETAEDYTRIFRELGVEDVQALDVRVRSEADDPKNLKKLDNAAVVFFTGGNQLRITSQLAGSRLFERIVAMYEQGGTIAGTSAGAAAMPETMIIAGPGDSTEVDSVGMAPGLGLLANIITDSHFAERGRIGRLLGAVVQNPGHLGLGIDEDTAVVMRGDSFRVLGSGAVYVVDGSGISYSSLAEKGRGVTTIHDVVLHTLGEGAEFDLKRRRPVVPSTDDAE